MKVFCINAGIAFGHSGGKLNHAITDLIEKTVLEQGSEFQRTDIEEGYDTEKEVEKHLWADLVITQSPMWWFSAPWVHKKYIDEVFMAGHGKLWQHDGRYPEEAGHQYGTGGLTSGKKHLFSMTMNAPLEAFGNLEQKHFQGLKVDEVLFSVNASYKFCGFEILPPFTFHDVIKKPKIPQELAKLTEYLTKIIKE